MTRLEQGSRRYPGEFGHIPAPIVGKILAEMAERGLVSEENGIWGLTGAGAEIEKEIKKRG